jgi:hypothetical protein
MRPPSTTNPSTRQRPEPRRFEGLLAVPWALMTLSFSITFVGTKLFLICIYGWSKVRDEHLRILDMPKGQPWPVSNGDLIRDWQALHFVISLVSWLVLFAATYPLLRLLLPKRKPAVA